MNIYDLIIVGAGPAGLSAAVYAARYKLNFVVIGRIGKSAVAYSHKIENYPGINSISGKQFIQNLYDQAARLGANIEEQDVVDIIKKDDFFEVISKDNIAYKGRNIILAVGTEKIKLGVKGEKEFVGKGVSYCATCDAPFFVDKKVVVVGGSDSAAKTALCLANYAKKVYLIYRKGKLRAEPFWVEKIKIEQKIEVVYNTNIKEITGERVVTGVILDSRFCENDKLTIDGVFVEIGSIPNSSLTYKLGVDVDIDNYIKINTKGETNIFGIYAAGDVSDGSNKFRQIITAAAEGAISAGSVYAKLK